jgi:glycosyltransferase involved in cell wall biosynthesis
MEKILSQASVAQDTAAACPSKRPIRICIHFLGTARSYYRLLREATSLAEAGFAVSIVDVEAERTRPIEENIKGIFFKHIFMPNWFVSARFKPWFLVKLVLMFIVGTIRLLRTDADIYHATVEKALPACYIAALLRHKPLIFDSSELPLSEPNVVHWRTLHALSTFILTALARRCAGVISVSPPIVEEIRKRYQVAEVTLIRNVPILQIVQKSNRLREFLGLSANIRIALYQGGLQADRRLETLIRAARYLAPDIVIVMMGTGPREIVSQLEALIASEGVADRVKIIPPAPYSELLDWTSSADLGLIVYSPDHSLNVQMCLPNKFFEFLMAGLPVLSSQLDAITEIISIYEVGEVVASLAPCNVAQAINSMLADHPALARMRHNALAVAQREFYWEKESQKLIQLYKKILMKCSMEKGVRDAFSY